MKCYLLVGALASFGCASTSPKPAFDDTARMVQERSGQAIAWSEDDDRAAIDRTVAGLLGTPLTPQAAVQVALLRNRHLQATFEDLGVAQAELVQAGLLKNPTLFGSIHFPLSTGAVADGTLIGAFDFIDAFSVPAKKHIAASRLAATKARVADSVLDLAHETAAAYYAAISASQILAMRRAVLEAGEAATEIARRLAAAGNTSELDLANREMELEALTLEALRAEAMAAGTREALTRRMGLFGMATTYALPEKLPELPKDDALPDYLESLAITQRLDLTAAHEDAQSISHELAMFRNFRLWGLIGPVEGAYEKTFAGSEVAGPGTTLELPIFDQKQAVGARLEARLRQSLDREEALAVDIRSEVREVRARVGFARKFVESYQTRIVPLREHVVQLTEERYNAMLAGVFQLVMAKQLEVEAYASLIDGLRNYWTSRSDLERAVGGRLGEQPTTNTSNAGTTAPKQQMPDMPDMPGMNMHDMKNMQH